MKHILFVDDDPHLGDVVVYALEREGFRVSAARDGEAALERVRGGGIDLVVLDVTMPELDGLEVCRRLRGAEATRAIYPEHELEHVGEALRARYFLRSRDPDEKLVRVTPALRRHAEFRRQNLMDGRYQVPAAFDVVMLRNVLIYFDKQTQRAVVERTIEHLRPGGVFCTSMAESLQGFALPLQPLGRGVYRKGDRA